MATLRREEIIAAFQRLGELAEAQDTKVELALVGGALMVLLYEARESTQDVDAIVLAPAQSNVVMNLARLVARERGWPDDWLNDGAKGYLVGLSTGPIVFSSVGIVVYGLAIEQLLAMKLSAWRDDVDISDALRLLQAMSGTRDGIWQAVEAYLVPGEELKAQYAFADLWEGLHGDD